MIAVEQLNGQAVFSRLLTHVKNTSEALTKVAPCPSEYSWEGLFENWKCKRRPKRTEQHPHTLRLLKQILGDMDYRKVTPHHIDQFLKGMDKRGISKPMQGKIRERVSGMFKAAVPLKIKLNLCTGVTVDGKPEKIKVQPFSGEQERAIFATAAKTCYGSERYTEAVCSCFSLFLLLLTLAAKLDELNGQKESALQQLNHANIALEKLRPLVTGSIDVKDFANR